MVPFLQSHGTSRAFHNTNATAFTVVHINPPGIFHGNRCFGTKQAAVITIDASCRKIVFRKRLPISGSNRPAF